jgi:hypothetical protein
MNELNLNSNIIGGDDGDSYISNIKNAIKSTNLIMIIMRGLPGKSLFLFKIFSFYLSLILF